MGGSSSSKGKFRTLITLQGFSTGAQADTIGLKRRMQSPPSSAPSTTVPRQVEVIVTQAPELTQPETVAAASCPESLAALLTYSRGLQHHEKAFQAEGYTLDSLLSSMKQGDAAASGAICARAHEAESEGVPAADQNHLKACKFQIEYTAHATQQHTPGGSTGPRPSPGCCWQIQSSKVHKKDPSI